MRIAVVNWSSRRVGGAEEYVAMLLPALRGAGHDVLFFHEFDTPPTRQRIDSRGGVIDVCVADSGTPQALETLRRWRPDVIYVQGVRDSSLERELLSVAPSVFFLHTYTGTCISGGKTFTRPKAVPCDRTLGWPCLVHYLPHGCGGLSPITMWTQYRQQQRQLAMLGDYSILVTHSLHMQAEMERHGIKAQVIPFPAKARRHERAHELSKTWRLLFVGRMEHLKGGLHLLDALPRIARAAGGPVALTLAGDGSERSRWEARARTVMAATPSLTIRFAGWVEEQAADQLLSESDLLVVPSLWPEPFGLVGPEAAQQGVPAAAFDVGGISQWLKVGVSGHLAPGNPPTPAGLAAAVGRCLADPEHYASLSRGALEVSTQFTMARHLSALESVLGHACR